MRSKSKPKCDRRGAYMYLRDPEELRRRIDERQLTIREFAVLAAVSPGFVSHLMPARATPGERPRKRTCSPDVARRIAKAARCHVDDLFDARYDQEDDVDDTSTFALPSVAIGGSNFDQRRSA